MTRYEVEMWLNNDPCDDVERPALAAPWKRRPSWYAGVFGRADVATSAQRPLDAVFGCLGALLRQDQQIAEWHERYAAKGYLRRVCEEVG